MINVYRQLSTKSIQHRLILGLIFLAPLAWLSIRGWVNGVVMILSFLCIFFLFSNRKKIELEILEKLFLATLILPFLAVLITQILTQNWSAKAYDGPSRFLLGIPIYLYIRREKIDVLRILVIAIPLTLIFNLLSTLLNTGPTEFWGNRLATYFVDPLTFGNYSLLLGFLCLLLVQYREYFTTSLLKKIFVMTCLTGFVIGLYLSIGSMSRSGWLALPFLILYCAWCLRKDMLGNLNTSLLFLFLTLALFFLLILFNELLQIRFLSIYSETSQWLNKSGEYDSSSGGTRLSMWVLSYKLFMMNPLIGYGDLGYKDLLVTDPTLISSASVMARTSMFNGPHNEILANSLRYGIFGLIATSSLFIIPAIIAVLNTQKQDNLARRLIFCFIVGLLICSIALEVFNLKYTASFYAFLIPVLMATSYNLKESI